MATTFKGTAIWKGDIGNPDRHIARMVLNHPTDDTTWSTFLTAIDVHTDCVLEGNTVSFITRNVVDPPGSNVDVDVRGIIVMLDTDYNTTHRFQIPAPVSTDIELTTSGRRYTAAAVSTIVGLINTATGKNYSGLYGYVIEKK